MSIRSVISGSVRGVLIAAATGATAFGLLVVFHPFAATGAAQSQSISASASSDALKQRIDMARDALRQTETALDEATGRSLAVTSPSRVSDMTAQLAAAIDRRDLALRHAKAIRDALAAGADLSALAEIRDSVVVGQLLGRQIALDAQIAEQGARLKPNHPTMRALNAQRAALLAQIKSEATGIASALEVEANLDDVQIKLLQSRPSAGPVTASDAPADTTALETEAAAQRTELDNLMDAYFGLKPGAAAPATAATTTANLLSPLNLFVTAVAVIAALMFQIGLAQRARRRREALDLALFESDVDTEIVADPVPVSEPDAVLRRAS